MSNYQQLMMQRIFQPEGGWTYAVYLAGMFALVLARRESVLNVRLFRTSYLMFAAALVLPPIVLPFLPILTQSNSMNGDGQILTSIVATGLGPVLFAGAVICALSSMLPPRTRSWQPAGPPPKHPLD
jgi:hypothetical protein